MACSTIMVQSNSNREGIILKLIAVLIVAGIAHLTPLPMEKEKPPSLMVHEGSSVPIVKPIAVEPAKAITAPEPEKVATTPPPAQNAPVAAPVAPQGGCESWMVQAGVTDIVNARELISRESGCRVDADNPSSDAYGIPQALPGSKMASEGADWATNPVTQIRWMQKYVMERYGSWGAAVAYHNSHNWY